jgi:hypothetical protein
LFIVFEDRPSDSPFVERVWRCHSERAGTFHSMAAGHWEMVVSRYAGHVSLTVRGPETRASSAECPAEGDWLAIRFKLGTFMPLLPPSDLRDRNDATLPSASSSSFWLKGSAWEYPDFENAETFVRRLARTGLLAVDPCVNDALRGHLPTLTARTSQRRFRQATGLTQAALRQIQRARRAAILLREGTPILDTAFATGYYDQAHLTRSLRRFIGLTPAQIQRGEQQMSFLYNTEKEEPLMV